MKLINVEFARLKTSLKGIFIKSSSSVLVHVAWRMLKMKQWQKQALVVIREARAHATETADMHLQLACTRTIEAMIMEGGQVPADLREYARMTREVQITYGSPQPRSGVS
jgi:hypothetical protein